jgi:electron transport complex protein RnfG
VEVLAPHWLGVDAPQPVHRARKAGAPVAVVLAAVAPDGYNGDIKLVVGITYEGDVSGVRVIAHRETPGLGDGIEEARSDWILQFKDRSLVSPPPEGWKVKRDGGIFDQFTGATITPRAVVRAVHKCLQFYSAHQTDLYEAEGKQVLVFPAN